MTEELKEDWLLEPPEPSQTQQHILAYLGNLVISKAPFLKLDLALPLSKFEKLQF